MKKVILITLFIHFVIINCISQIPTNGLVGYWPFNGNSNDVSPNGNNGGVFGAVSITDRLGNANSAYGFDGINDYILVPNDASLNFQNSHSICVWFKTTNPIIPGEWAGCLVSMEKTVGNRSYYMFLSQPGGCCVDSFSYYLFNSSDVLIKSTLEFSNYYDDKWHMITTSYNYSTGETKTYVDALLKNTTQAGQFTLEQTTLPLLFGGSNDVISGYRWFYKGSLDDICLFNRVLTDAEILSIYNDNSYLGDPTIQTNTSCEIFISPNPANNFINISTSIAVFKDVKIDIINSKGNILMSTCINKQSEPFNQNIDVSIIPEGFYLIKTAIDNIIYTNKITINRK